MCVPSQNQRIYQTDGSGYASQMPYVGDGVGGCKFSPVRNAGRFPVNQVNASGGFLLTSGQSVQSNGSGGGTILEVENQYGGKDVARAEKAGQQGATKTVQLTLTNGSGASQQVIVGDGSTLNQQLLGIGALPATVVVGGTYGVNTLNFFKSFSIGGAIRCKGIRVSQAAGGTFITAGLLRQVIAQFGDQNASVVDLAVATWQSPDAQNNNLVINPDIRAFFSPQSGLVATLPDAFAVTLTFQVQSVSDSYLMGLVGN